MERGDGGWEGGGGEEMEEGGGEERERRRRKKKKEVYMNILYSVNIILFFVAL